MNEILHRLKSINLKRRGLVIGLITAEIIGIIALLWYLRTPLIEKLFVNPPKAYSVESFDFKKTYLLHQGDFLKGKADTQSKVVAIIRQGKKKADTQKLVLSQNGDWTYQIPENIEPGRYRFTLGFEDKDKEIYAENYKINIKSRYKNIPLISNLLNSPKFKIENITQQLSPYETQGTKNAFFRLMVDKQQRTAKQLESGTVSSHSAPQDLLKNKPSISTNSAIFFVEIKSKEGEPIQSGWLKLTVPNLNTAKQFEITIYSDNPEAKSIKLFDEKMKFIWGNMI